MIDSVRYKEKIEVYGIFLTDKSVGIYNLIKRVLDILFSLLSLIIVIPLIAIFSLLIIIESPGNPFFLQTRMGLLGKEFNLIKLRSMHQDAEKLGAQWAEKDDPRVTRIGRFIRKCRIDELPQVMNIIKGDMALIGPRPERKVFVEEFVKTIPEFPKRLEMKPGLTGWAQVNGGYDISPVEKLVLDQYYIKNVSIALDARILWKTVRVILEGEGAR